MHAKILFMAIFGLLFYQLWTFQDSMFNSQTQNRGAASSASASMRKASSTTNIADDLSAIFGGGTDQPKCSSSEHTRFCNIIGYRYNSFG
jgi:hypothetical protein